LATFLKKLSKIVISNFVKNIGEHSICNFSTTVIFFGGREIVQGGGEIFGNSVSVKC